MRRFTIRNRMGREKTLYARKLRKNPTSSEKRLWELLRKRRMLGYKFIRQRTMVGYIADFYCPQLRLVIEVDGPYHELPEQKYQDYLRDKRLLTRNITTYRIVELKIMQNTLNFLRKEIEEYILTMDDRRDFIIL